MRNLWEQIPIKNIRRILKIFRKKNPSYKEELDKRFSQSAKET